MADTAITVQTVIDQSLARAKDTTKTQWTDATLLYWLNKAKNYISDILVNLNSELVISEGAIDLVSDTQEYDLSGNLDNFIKPKQRGFYFSDEKPLIQVTTEAKVRNGTSKTGTGGAAPTLFYLTGSQVGLVKIPSSQTVAAYPTLNCRYFYRIDDLTLIDDMPWKNIFNDAMSVFMSGIAVLKTTDPKQEYDEFYNALEQQTMNIIKDRDIT